MKTALRGGQCPTTACLKRSLDELTRLLVDAHDGKASTRAMHFSLLALEAIATDDPSTDLFLRVVAIFLSIAGSLCAAFNRLQDQCRNAAFVDTVGKSLSLRDLDGAADLAAKRIDRIYRTSKLGAIAWRKQIRRSLAKGWQAVDTENYVIVHHTKSKGLIKRIARDIEAMRSFYMNLFPPTGYVDKVSVLRLCQTKEEYHQYGGPPNTGGYWHPGNEELVLFDYSYTQKKMTAKQKKAMGGRKLSSKDSMLVLRHEAFHQCSSITLFLHE